MYASTQASPGMYLLVVIASTGPKQSYLQAGESHATNRELGRSLIYKLQGVSFCGNPFFILVVECFSVTVSKRHMSDSTWSSGVTCTPYYLCRVTLCTYKKMVRKKAEKKSWEKEPGGNYYVGRRRSSPLPFCCRPSAPPGICRSLRHHNFLYSPGKRESAPRGFLFQPWSARWTSSHPFMILWFCLSKKHTQGR